MAGLPTTFHKNDGTDTYETSSFMKFPTAESLGWSRDGYTFVSWNTRADGTGESFAEGSENPIPSETGYGAYYAIWEPLPPSYLDLEGLSHYTDLIMDEINGKVDAGGKAGGIPYGSVDSTSTSTVFTATVDGLTELYDGACVMLHNGVVSSASNFTVNVNGLGAKKCYNNLTNATQDSTIFNVNYTLMFVYSTALDSGNGGWWIYRGYDSDENLVLLEYGKSTWADFESAYDANRVVYCLAEVSNNYRLAYRLAFMAYRTSSDVEFQYYRTVDKKSATQQGDEVYIYKLNNKSSWTTIVRQNYTKIVAGTGLTSTYSAGTLTLKSTPATTSKLGGVKVGTGLSVATDGTLSANDIADGSITTAKLENYAVTTAKLGSYAVTNDKIAMHTITMDNLSYDLAESLSEIEFVATDATTQAVMANSGQTAVVIAPNAFGASDESNNSRTRLCWFTMANGLEVAPIGYAADLQGVLTFYARGLHTMASGTMNDTAWTITALPTDADGVSY